MTASIVFLSLTQDEYSRSLTYYPIRFKASSISSNRNFQFLGDTNCLLEDSFLQLFFECTFGNEINWPSHKGFQILLQSEKFEYSRSIATQDKDIDIAIRPGSASAY